MIKAIFNSVLITSMILVVSLSLTFVIINLFLGCETWDRELWTAYNSCIMPMEMIGFR
mgnify:FL=1|tara:strand:+ start:117 stop:290 length:174 start_codon:yes stop_codon:yes gene_type:complete